MVLPVAVSHSVTDIGKWYGNILTGKTEVLGGVSLCTPQILHVLARDQSQVSAVSGLSHGMAKYEVVVACCKELRTAIKTDEH
jgi:hypothetical protein